MYSERIINREKLKKTELHERAMRMQNRLESGDLRDFDYLKIVNFNNVRESRPEEINQTREQGGEVEEKDERDEREMVERQESRTVCMQQISHDK